MFLAPASPRVGNGLNTIGMIVQPGGEADPPMPPPFMTAAQFPSHFVPAEQLQPMGESDLPEPPPSSCSPQLPGHKCPSCSSIQGYKCPSCSSSAMEEDDWNPLLRYDPVDHLRHMGQAMWEQRLFTDLSIVVEGCEIARAHRSILAAASPRIGAMLRVWECRHGGGGLDRASASIAGRYPSASSAGAPSDRDAEPERDAATLANAGAEQFADIGREARNDASLPEATDAITLAANLSANGEPVLEFDADAAAVEAMLRFVYTGSLPKDVDLRAVLSLAHSYGIQGLAAHCCHALSSETLTAGNVVEKMRVLRSCDDNDVAQRAYKAICDRAFEERDLFDALMSNV